MSFLAAGVIINTLVALEIQCFTIVLYVPWRRQKQNEIKSQKNTHIRNKNLGRLIYPHGRREQNHNVTCNTISLKDDLVEGGPPKLCHSIFWELHLRNTS